VTAGPTPVADADVVVSMRDVHKSYHGTPVLQGISMDVRRGEVEGAIHQVVAWSSEQHAR